MNPDFWIGVAGSAFGASIGVYFADRYGSAIQRATVEGVSRAVAESLRKEYAYEHPEIAFRRRLRPLGLY